MITTAVVFVCVNTLCVSKTLHKKTLNRLKQSNRQHLHNSVSKVCNSTSRMAENNYKQSVTDSVNSVMQSVYAKFNRSCRYCTLFVNSVSSKTRCTLFLNALQLRYAVCAHRVRRMLQVVVAGFNSVVLPCLQIRVGRFDSGPRLQIAALSSFELRAVFFDAYRFRSFNIDLNPTQGKRLMHC